MSTKSHYICLTDIMYLSCIKCVSINTSVSLAINSDRRNKATRSFDKCLQFYLTGQQIKAERS